MGMHKCRCLCGSVRFNLMSFSDEVVFCHCDQCRRWGGGLPLAAVNGEVKDLEGDDFVSWYESSPWARRGFCNRCGSSLFWRLLDGGESFWFISAGSLESCSGLSIKKHIYVDDGAEFYQFSDGAPCLRSDEFVAELALRFRKDRGEDYFREMMSGIRAHNAEFSARVESHFPDE